jgi:hypothetical protein
MAALLTALWVQLLAAAPAAAVSKPEFVRPAVPGRVIVRLTEAPVAVRIADISGGGGVGPTRRLAAAASAASAAVATQHSAVLGQMANARMAVKVEHTYSQARFISLPATL